MSLNPRAIREAIAATLRAGVAREVHVYPYPPDSPQFPCVIVHAGDSPGGGGEYLAYHESFSDGSVVAVRMCLQVIYAATRSTDSLIALDDLLATVGSSGAVSGFESSIIDVIERDRTLGGVVNTCHVGMAFAPRMVIDQDSSFQGWASTVRLSIAHKR